MANKNVWDPDWDISDESAQQLIYSQFPQLSAYALQRLGHGWEIRSSSLAASTSFDFREESLQWI
ncbi:hypothetical protein [Brevibacillus nitrificans]|uniref:hypothetical protein n=1 Tax=Brevibacillus nitrificans TaxID=651560 RepID=UPI0033A634E9